MPKNAKPAGKPALIRRRTSAPVVDFHTHIMSPGVAETVQRLRPPESPEYKLIDGYRRGEGNFRHRHPRPQADTPIDARLADMDSLGIDIHVVSGHVGQFCYWTDGKTGLEIARQGNDDIAEMCAANPGRFIGLGMVPMQDIGATLRELDRMVGKLGLSGVIIGTHVEGFELGDKKFNRFWAKIEKLAIPVFIHPAGFVHPRFSKHLLWNSLGQPIEEALALSSLIYEGVMDRYPGLKIVVAHGGGFLPFYIGRADRNFKEKPEAFTISRSPSDYLKLFYFDTAFYNRDMLAFLIQKVGPSRVIMGADYPIGEDDPVSFIRSVKGLSARAQTMMAGSTAARLLGL